MWDDVWGRRSGSMYMGVREEAREFGRRMWELGRKNGAASAAELLCGANELWTLHITAPEPATPGEHPSIAWWAACPWVTDRPPTIEDADKDGCVLWDLSEDTWVEHWVGDWRIKKTGRWIHTFDWWRPPTPSPQRWASALTLS